MSIILYSNHLFDMQKNKKNRRYFIKNTSLSLLSIAALPKILLSNKRDGNEIENSNTAQGCEVSTEDAYGQGPFYTADAPVIVDGQLASEDEVGQRMIISGYVYNLDCSQVITNVEIDVWHADTSGAYDNSGYNLRGITYTNYQGFYSFETIKPGFYPNGSRYRPSHIHIKITPPGAEPLITQLYFEGDEYIQEDYAASQTSGSFDATNRIIALNENAQGVLEGTWDIVIDDQGVNTSLTPIHLDKGIVYKAFPNPFIDKLEIVFGIFQSSKVEVVVYDMIGREVVVLENRTINPQKYSIIWNADASLPSGNYFVSVKLNDLQIHSIKVIKK